MRGKWVLGQTAGTNISVPLLNSCFPMSKLQILINPQFYHLKCRYNNDPNLRFEKVDEMVQVTCLLPKTYQALRWAVILWLEIVVHLQAIVIYLGFYSNRHHDHALHTDLIGSFVLLSLYVFLIFPVEREYNFCNLTTSSFYPQSVPYKRKYLINRYFLSLHIFI